MALTNDTSYRLTVALGSYPASTEVQAAMLVSQPTTTALHIDSSRSDSYTADGTTFRPFKTWAAAHAYAVLNTIATVKFVFDGAGTLAEKVYLDWSGFYNVTIDGGDAWDITPASGAAFECITNNENIATLRVLGLHFSSEAKIIGASNSQLIGADAMEFKHCDFHGLTIKNVIQGLIEDSTVYGDQVFENIGTGALVISGGNGISPATAMTVVTNTSNPHSSGFSQTIVIIEKTIAGADATVDAGSLLQYREGCRIGYPGGTITNAGSLQAYNCFFRSDIVNSGSFVDRFNGFNGALSGAGTHTVDGGPSYVPTTASDWTGTAPTKLQGALDRIAAALNAAGHKP